MGNIFIKDFSAGNLPGIIKFAAKIDQYIGPFTPTPDSKRDK
jgi:hypothetical protein